MLLRRHIENRVMQEEPKPERAVEAVKPAEPVAQEKIEEAKPEKAAAVKKSTKKK